MRGHNDIQAICNGIVAGHLDRFADRSSRSDHFGQLRSYSTVYSDSAYKAHGPQWNTCGECGLEWGIIYQHQLQYRTARVLYRYE
jgi:hypothetical protein